MDRGKEETEHEGWDGERKKREANLYTPITAPPHEGQLTHRHEQTEN